VALDCCGAVPIGGMGPGDDGVALDSCEAVSIGGTEPGDDGQNRSTVKWH
jgi:hypothetical protein